MTTVRATTVFTDERLTVTAIETLEFRAVRTKRGGHVTGVLKPTAIIVREPNRTRALDMNAQLLDLDQLELPADFEL